MTGGVLLAVVGVFVLSQVLGGNALGRLGISGQPSEVGKTTSVPNVGTMSGSRSLMPNAIG